jgi:hypothetical protein
VALDPPEPTTPVTDQRLVHRIRETGSCTWLLGALILLLIIYPIVGESLQWTLLIGVLNTAVLISGAFAASRARKTLIIAFGFALPALALEWLWIISYDKNIGLLFTVTLLLFYSFTIGHLLVYVLRPGSVTGNKLHGAISAFLMLGLFWAFFYELIETMVPGSFVNLAEQHREQTVEWGQFVFFSFTTLTTTGYGDIVPVKGHAQSAAILEQLMGVLYVAVLIARLAGLYEPGSAGRSHR